MNRRKSVATKPPAWPGFDELVAQLTNGSALARDRLAVHVRCARLDPEADVGSMYDRIAVAAAAGSANNIDLLLELISEHDLAGPAIGRLTSDRTVAADAEQDVLVAVSQSITGFRGEARFTTWLYSVARNVTVAHLRRSTSDGVLGQDDRLEDGAARRMSSVVAERQVVRQAIESLPSTLRQTVLLRDIEGLSYREIAALQGLELNTVRSRLSRGRAMLAVRLS